MGTILYTMSLWTMLMLFPLRSTQISSTYCFSHHIPCSCFLYSLLTNIFFFLYINNTYDTIAIHRKQEGISEEEEALLTRREKLIQLQSLYRLQTIRLRDKLKTKHRKFVKNQKKELQQLLDSLAADEMSNSITNNNNNNTSSSSSKDAGGAGVGGDSSLLDQYQHFKHSKPRMAVTTERKQKKLEKQDESKKTLKTCTYEECGGKCLPLTDYCYARMYMLLLSIYLSNLSIHLSISISQPIVSVSYFYLFLSQIF